MMKKNQLLWVLFLYGLMIMGSYASNSPATTPHPILQCQLSLQKISGYLRQVAKDRTNQKYYANLYQQTQDFLKKLDTLPLNSFEAMEMGERCQNLTHVIRSIVGHSIPGIQNSSSLSLQNRCPSGQLTMRKLDTATIAEIRHYRHRGVKYICNGNTPSFKLRSKEKGKEEVEENNGEDVRYILPSSLSGHPTELNDDRENRN